jgi:phage terminase large subunit GpA-like protein
MNDPQRWMNFKNSWLAEVFEERVSSMKVGELRSRATNAPKPNVIPEWAGITIASADVKKEGIHYVIRSWGHNRKSQLIYHDFLVGSNALDLLYQRCLNTSLVTESGDLTLPDKLIIDAGWNTNAIYEFALTDDRIVPVKGANQRQQSPVHLSANVYKEFGVPLRIIDTHFFKDQLAYLRADADRWLVHNSITDEYCNHLCAEHKIVITNKGVVMEKWEKVSGGAANHYFDCEVYNCVGAQIEGVDQIPPPETLAEIRQQNRESEEARMAKQELPQKRWFGNTSGWLKR